MTAVAHQCVATVQFDSLTLGRTVERALVHRKALAEVFVTDLARVDDQRFVAAAQLPRAHSYYTDHLLTSGTVDPLLLQECCRQASTMLVHQFFDVPMSTAFLVTRWDMELAGPQLVGSPDRPGELFLTLSTHDVKIRGGQLSSLSLVIEMYFEGQCVGTMNIGAAYLPSDRYQAFRSLRRAEPRMSDQLVERVPGRPATPALVGRRHEGNVVLADVERASDRVLARLDVPVRHPSLYDHPLDHVPAMALLEAARQIALVAVGDGQTAGPHYPTRFDAEFTKFVELDLPVEVTAVAFDGRVRVDFVQDDATVCTASVTLVASPHKESER